MSDRQVTDATPYVDSLVKLIPSEFIAAYLAIHTTVISTALPGEHQQYILVICGIILLFVQPFYLLKMLSISNISQIFVSCVSFIIWVISLGGILDYYDWYLPVYSTLAIIIWTIASPVVVSK